MSGFRVWQIEDSPLWAASAGYYSPKLDEGLSRLAAALKKMGKREGRAV